jgi:hypothetical protein
MPDDQTFLKAIQSESAEERFSAWRAAGSASPSVIPQLGKLAASSNPGVAKAAREALATMVHSVGKDPNSKNRAEIVKNLLELAGPAYEHTVRVHALRLLSNIAGEEAVPAISRWIHDPELSEEVAYCLERIPGSASIKALAAAYKDAREDFKPRILAALGHRRVEEGVSLSLEAMRSPNKELAVAGVKAFGRIGRKAPSSPKFPDPKSLSEWQRIEQMDSMLRYADAQAAEGNTAEAMRIYRTALEKPEEHWQCAAIIGMAKLGTAEAAAAILPKMKSENRTVRITAQNAWKRMAAG